MLNAKNGVITEDRFQKLSLAQWLFHYLEVIKFKSEEDKNNIGLISDLVKAYDSRMEILLETVMESGKLAGIISNPKVGKEILDREQLEKDKLAIKDEDFDDYWEKFVQFIPKQLSVTGVGDAIDLEGDGYDLEHFHEEMANMIEREIKKDKTNNNDNKGGEISDDRKQ